VYWWHLKQKDLENLAQVKTENYEHFVAYDKDCEQTDVEYITPKEFVKLFKLKPYKIEY